LYKYVGVHLGAVFKLLDSRSKADNQIARKKIKITTNSKLYYPEEKAK
jgi:hypothetical protein